MIDFYGDSEINVKELEFEDEKKRLIFRNIFKSYAKSRPCEQKYADFSHVGLPEIIRFLNN
jgi:hypothetical protein